MKLYGLIMKASALVKSAAFITAQTTTCVHGLNIGAGTAC